MRYDILGSRYPIQLCQVSAKMPAALPARIWFTTPSTRHSKQFQEKFIEVLRLQTKSAIAREATRRRPKLDIASIQMLVGPDHS